MAILARGWIACAMLAGFLLGCQGKSPVDPSISATTTPALIQPSSTSPSASEEAPLFPASTPSASEPTSLPDPSVGLLDTPYPDPGDMAVPGSGYPYPGWVTPIPNAAYPEAQAPPPTSSLTDSAYPLPLASATAIQQVVPTSILQTPEAAATPEEQMPPERVVQPLGTPPESSGTVTIWHAWSETEAAALMQVVSAFQKSYPDVRFDVMALPETELLTRYEVDAYNGRGPTLLIGPSDWTAYLVDRQLIENLEPYVSPAFSRTVYPAALETGSYQGQLACLPLSLSGALLYRNTQILPEPASTVEEMLLQAEEATRAGKVGAYLERGFSFSFAHLYGLGGRLVDENGAPAFQAQDFRHSLAWLDVLESFARPGAYALNDELDTSLFKQNRAGYLIDGSWNLAALANAIGKQNLAVDAWPALQGGYLSGYVKAESLYLNVNTAGDSTENHLATLQFMGYLMTVPVQEFLAEQGFIPSLPAAQPRDPLLAQAHAAFARGTAYPAVLLSKDGALRLIYQDILDAALVDVFKNGVAPRVALENALQDIEQRLEELK